MGYQKNPYVQSLLSQVRRGRIQPQRAGLALISNYENPNQWQAMPNNRVALEGAFQRAKELGYSLEEFSLANPEMNFTRLERILKSRGIRGLLIAPTPKERLDLKMEIDSFAIVSMGQSLRNRNLSTVSHYHAHSMRQTLAELTHLGYQRIGCSIDPGIDRRIEAGWSAHFQHHQANLPPDRQVPLHFRPAPSPVQDLRTYVKRHQIDALITDRHDHWQELLADGVSIPGELGYACLSLPPSGCEASGVLQNNERTGALAVELLVQLIDNGVFGQPSVPQFVFTPGEWRPGCTLQSQKNRHID